MRAIAALASTSVLLSACGGDASPERTYGGPLEDPAWRQGSALSIVVRPPEPGGRAAAGMAVVTNRGDEPAVVERVSLIEPGRDVRVAMMLSADHRRSFHGGDENDWPPRSDEYEPGSIRPAEGRSVPPAGSPGADLGLQLLVVVDVPRRRRYTFRGVRVDYRVGDARHWVDVPTAYAICPRGTRCPEARPIGQASGS